MDDQRHFVRQSLFALDEYKPDALLIAGDLYDRRDCLGRRDSFIRRAHRCAVRTEHPRRHHFRQPRQPDRIAVNCCAARHPYHHGLKDAFTPVEIGNIQIFRCRRTLKTPRCAKCWAMKRCAVQGPACARRWKKMEKAFDPRKSTFWSRTALRRGPPPSDSESRLFVGGAGDVPTDVFSPFDYAWRSGTYTRRKGQATRRATRAHRSNIP